MSQIEENVKVSPKLLYFTVIDVEKKCFAGVAKKVLGQVEAFRELGYDTYLLCFASDELTLFHNGQKTTYKHFSICGFHRCIQLYGHLAKLTRQIHFNLLYIRHPLCDAWFYLALKKARKYVDKAIFEIPTYPYDEENKKNKNLLSRFCHIQDTVFRTKLRNIIDLIVTYGKVTEAQIWGIPVKVIYNGVPEKSCKPIQPIPHETLNFVAVANLMHHHRYDKIIRGMAEYLSLPDSDKNLRFHIVGDGPEKEPLKKMAEQLKIEEYVVFHGILTGEKLYEVYRLSDLGLVGFEEKNHIDALKFSEYCSVGLPHTSSGPHSSYPVHNSFFIVSDSGTEKIPMAPLVDFAKTVNWKDAQQEMQQLVKSTLTWKCLIKQVLSALG